MKVFKVHRDNIPCAVSITTANNSLAAPIKMIHFLPFCLEDFKPTDPKDFPWLTLKLSDFISRSPLKKEYPITDKYLAPIEFEKWFDSLKLKPNGKLMPVCWNWGRLSILLHRFLNTGLKQPDEDVLDRYFSFLQIKDLSVITNYINDCVSKNGEYIVFADAWADTTRCLDRLGITIFSQDNIYADCINLINLYQAVLSIDYTHMLIPKRQK